MPSILLENAAKSQIDCPISIPQVQLAARSGVLVSQVELVAGTSLHIEYLGVHFLKYVHRGGTLKRNSGLPMVYCGLFYGAAEFLAIPSGHPVIWAGAEYPSYQQNADTGYMTFNQPGFYAFALVNNNSSCAVEVLAGGSARIS